MNTSMELVYGLLLLIFILGVTELLAFTVALVQRADAVAEFKLSFPDRMHGLSGYDQGVSPQPAAGDAAKREK